jgi:predicted acetyltransferase
MGEGKNKAEKAKSKNWFQGKKRYILWALLMFGIICIISIFLTENGVKLDWLTPISEIGGTLAVILTIVTLLKNHRKSTKKAEIELVNPKKEHEAIVGDFIKEHVENNESEIHGGALVEKLDYDVWLNQLANNSDKLTVSKDWVVASTFLAMRKSDRKLIGMIDIRHELNEFLQSYGGHIGLGIRPSERRKGYASKITMEGLSFCKKIGLHKVMLSCYKDNFASRKTIEKCGGKLEKEITLSAIENFPIFRENMEDKIVQVFWITIK